MAGNGPQREPGTRRRPVMTPVPVVRYETPAGRPAQCHWAAFGETETPDATVCQRWAFVYTLRYSRCLFVPCVRDTTPDSRLTCREHAFAPCGRVPEEILSDHRRPMVLVHPQGASSSGIPGFSTSRASRGLCGNAAKACHA